MLPEREDQLIPPPPFPSSENKSQETIDENAICKNQGKNRKNLGKKTGVVKVRGNSGVVTSPSRRRAGFSVGGIRKMVVFRVAKSELMEILAI